MQITRCTGRLLVAAVAVCLSVCYSLDATQRSRGTGPHEAVAALDLILFPAGCALAAIVLLTPVFLSRSATPIQKRIGVALLVLLMWGWSLYGWWGVRP